MGRVQRNLPKRASIPSQAEPKPRTGLRTPLEEMISFAKYKLFRTGGASTAHVSEIKIEIIPSSYL